MAKSMTGFGRYEAVTEEYKAIVEIKSVNHRYFDLSIKLPKKLNIFEQMVRGILKQNIGRGKVDVYIAYEDYTEAEVNVRYHSRLVQGYIDSIREISGEFDLETGPLNALAVSRMPDVLSLEEDVLDVEKLKPVITEAVNGALGQFVAARETEGRDLKEDVCKKLDLIEDYVTFIEARFPKIMEEYRTRITSKVEEMLGEKNIDESVLATELIIFADKVCVDEETVRLRSHILNMRNTLKDSEPMGRKLDFISQEMNREANTILSKANDMELSNKAIDLKTEIEKIREQIQNIE